MLDSDPPPGQHWLETGLPDFRGPEIDMGHVEVGAVHHTGVGA